MKSRRLWVALSLFALTVVGNPVLCGACGPDHCALLEVADKGRDDAHCPTQDAMAETARAATPSSDPQSTGTFGTPATTTCCAATLVPEAKPTAVPTMPISLDGVAAVPAFVPSPSFSEEVPRGRTERLRPGPLYTLNSSLLL